MLHLTSLISTDLYFHLCSEHYLQVLWIPQVQHTQTLSSSSRLNLLHLTVFYLTAWHHYHLLTWARCQGVFLVSSLFCTHCVLLNWGWTEDEGYGYRQVVNHCSLIIKKWSWRFISENKVTREHMVEVIHLILLSPHSPTIACVHIFTSSLLGHRNSLCNGRS